jgi:hypothetical protein
VVLDADGSHRNDGLGVILDVVIDTQVADTQLLRRERIRSQGLSVSRHHRRPLTQLLIDGV